MSKQSENEEAIDILLTSRADSLSEWEVNFLEDIYEVSWLTPGQQDKLDQIWSRVMEGK